MVMSSHHLYSLQLLNHAILDLAAAVSPVIFGILIVGVLIAILQGALQIEEGALAMLAKFAVILALSAGAFELVFSTLQHLAQDWITNAPHLIDRDWS
jgi:flagellar biosynthesis protein FliQ